MHDGEVHLWSARLDLSPATLRRLATILTAEELERAARQRLPRDGDRLIAARGILRTILARYLEYSPASIRLRNGPYGKPELDAAAGLRFNLSHAHDLALYAFACGRDVGVDLERIRPIIDHEAITAACFAEPERLVLRTLPEPRRRRAFYLAWTCKEAYLKARGLGHALALDTVVIDLTARTPRFAALDSGSGGLERWSLRELVVEPGFVAALVVDGALERLTRFHWNEKAGWSY